MAQVEFAGPLLWRQRINPSRVGTVIRAFVAGWGGELLGEEAVQPRAEGFVVEVQEPFAPAGRGNERM